jgi:hypothetical protein
LSSTFENRYGPIDRLLHRFAFRAGRTQRALADVEDLLHREVLEAVTLRNPVFITALPRSGTTILLELLWESGHFATHTYRDMPFVLCPMLWRRFSEPFGVDHTRRERAHGDGLEISGTSPEAFEEMIWKEFWPDHYQDDRILPWTTVEEAPDFDAFLESHMRKVVVLRREDASDERRYLSKNNLNIARIGAAPSVMDSGVFLVPFREPLQQAASMLRQHRRFTKIHAEDPFIRRYMEAIGHHEFGETLRPIDFADWLSEARDPGGLEFWVRYWIVAYRHVLDHVDASTRLISYAALTEEPEVSLARLADAIGLGASALVQQAERVHSPRTHDLDASRVETAIVEEARELYGELQDRAEIS